MKQIKLLAITTALLAATPVFAERGSFRERNENWLQRTENTENAETTGESLRIGNPGADPKVGSVGDGLLCLAACAGGFAIFLRRRYCKNKDAETYTIMD